MSKPNHAALHRHFENAQSRVVPVEALGILAEGARDLLVVEVLQSLSTDGQVIAFQDSLSVWVARVHLFQVSESLLGHSLADGLFHLLGSHRFSEDLLVSLHR